MAEIKAEDRVRAVEHFEQWWIKGNPYADTTKHAKTLLSLVEELQGQVAALTERANADRENLLQRRKHDEANREERNQLAERAETAEVEAEKARGARGDAGGSAKD
jgi:hypothetical protein